MKMRYKILIGFAAAFFLLSVSVYYLNHTFIPVKVKGILANAMKEHLKQDVDIGSLRFGIGKGFILDGITIYGPGGRDDEPFFSAERASFGAIFIPSIRTQRIIIPRVLLYNPHTKLERSGDGTWNLPAGLIKRADEAKARARFTAIVKAVSFDNATLDFKDSYNKRDFEKRLTRVSGNAGLSLPAYISLNCTAGRRSFPSDKAA